MKMSPSLFIVDLVKEQLLGGKDKVAAETSTNYGRVQQ